MKNSLVYRVRDKCTHLLIGTKHLGTDHGIELTPKNISQYSSEDTFKNLYTELKGFILFQIVINFLFYCIQYSFVSICNKISNRPRDPFDFSRYLNAFIDECAVYRNFIEKEPLIHKGVETLSLLLYVDSIGSLKSTEDMLPNWLLPYTKKINAAILPWLISAQIDTILISAYLCFCMQYHSVVHYLSFTIVGHQAKRMYDNYKILYYKGNKSDFYEQLYQRTFHGVDSPFSTELPMKFTEMHTSYFSLATRNYNMAEHIVNEEENSIFMFGAAHFCESHIPSVLHIINKVSPNAQIEALSNGKWVPATLNEGSDRSMLKNNSDNNSATLIRSAQNDFHIPTFKEHSIPSQRG